MCAYWNDLPRISLAAGQTWGMGADSEAICWVEMGLLATVFADTQGRERVHHFHSAAHWLAPPLGLPSHAWRIEAQIPSRMLVLSPRQLQDAKDLEPRIGDWILQALMAESMADAQRHRALPAGSARGAKLVRPSAAASSCQLSGLDRCSAFPYPTAVKSEALK
jgi:hypothetical protein